MTCRLDCRDGANCELHGKRACEVDCTGAQTCDVSCASNAHILCDAIQNNCSAAVGEGARVSCADANHCDIRCNGACDVSCPSGACRVSCTDLASCKVTCAEASDEADACSDGVTKVCGLPCREPRVLATLDDVVVDLTADKDNVYAAMADGELVRISRADGSTRVLTQSLEKAPGSSFAAWFGWHTLAIDDDAIYWTAPSAGSIHKQPLTGGETSTIATGQNAPLSLIAQGSKVYWKSAENISSTDKSGGYVTILTSVEGQTTGFSGDDMHLYWARFGDVGETSAIFECPIGGGGATMLATAENPWGIVVVGSFLYWGDGMQNAPISAHSATIKRVPIAGGNVDTVLTGQDVPLHLTAEGSHLYWLSLGSGRVMRANLDGQDLVTLAETSSKAFGGIAVSNGMVYWAIDQNVMAQES